MNILSYRQFLNDRRNNIFSSGILERSQAGWGKIIGPSLHEGLSLQGGQVVADFSQDSEEDVVRLNPPVPTAPVRKLNVPVYRGYSMEKRDDRKEFMETIKGADSIPQADLEKLVELTFPRELAERNVKILFTTGSADPLAIRIAEAIRSLYYPKAQIIDVLKKYYGADATDVVDWEAYDKSDPKTKKMIDSYLKKTSPGFSGYIKKSSGLQSGARRLLKAGHDIDSYIINKMVDAEESWRKDYLGNRNVNPNMAIKFRPAYLFVDDLIIEGSTLRGIFKQMMDAVMAGETNSSVRGMMKSSIYGYCLFSYKNVGNY